MCSIGALPLPTASSRPEKYDDRYRYDPRFTGSFDDEPEPPRDPYGEEVDRRSEHSEHSARSLRSAPSLQSRRSSFSAHSHQVGGGRLRGHLGSRGAAKGLHLSTLCSRRVRCTGVITCPPGPMRCPLRRAPSTVITPTAPTGATSMAHQAFQSTATPPRPAGPPWSKVCVQGPGLTQCGGAQGLLGPASAPAARRAGLRPRWELVMVGPGLPWELLACPSHPLQCSAALRLPAQVSSPCGGTAAPTRHPPCEADRTGAWLLEEAWFSLQSS